MEHLFVYGIYRRDSGHPVTDTLEKLGIFEGPALCPGRLQNRDGQEILLGARSEEEFATGEVYELKDPDQVFLELDLYHGFDPARETKSEFVRRAILVRLESGEERLAWAYFYNGRIGDSGGPPHGRGGRKKRPFTGAGGGPPH